MRCSYCGWDNPDGNDRCEKCNSLITPHVGGHPGDEHPMMGYVEPPFPMEIDNSNLMKFGISPSSENKVCPNHHAYHGSSILGCPYCGEWKVIGYADMHEGEKYHILGRSANQVVKVVIDGEEYPLCDLKIGYWVWDWASRIKSDYVIETGGGEKIGITCHTEIVFGSTHMTGKEFIKMCDVIIDNQLAIIGV